MYNLITIVIPFKLLRCQWALPIKSIVSNSNNIEGTLVFTCMYSMYGMYCIIMIVNIVTMTSGPGN